MIGRGAAADGISTFGVASYRISAASIASSCVAARSILPLGISAFDEGRFAVRPTGFSSASHSAAAFGISSAGRASECIASASDTACCRPTMRMALRKTLAVKI